MEKPPAISGISGELGAVDRVLGGVSDVVLFKRRQNAAESDLSDGFVSFEPADLALLPPSIVSSGMAILVPAGDWRGLSGCVRLCAAEQSGAGFILASTLGAAMMIAAVPYRYSGAQLEILWLVDSKALLLIAAWRLSKNAAKASVAGCSADDVCVAARRDAASREVEAEPDAKLGDLSPVRGDVHCSLNGWLKARVGEVGARWIQWRSCWLQLHELDLVSSGIGRLPLMWTAFAWWSRWRWWMRKEIQGQSAGVVRARGGGVSGDAAADFEFATRGNVATASACRAEYSRCVMRDFVCGIRDGRCNYREGWRDRSERPGDFFSRLATSTRISGAYTAASTLLAEICVWSRRRAGRSPSAGTFGLVLECGGGNELGGEQVGADFLSRGCRGARGAYDFGGRVNGADGVGDYDGCE